MNKMMDIFFSPGKVFTSLREKPDWLKPFVVILLVIAIVSVLSFVLSRDTIIAQQEEMMRERGLTDEQIEQAQSITGSPVIMVVSGISGAFFTAIVLVLFTLILFLLVPLFRGKAQFPVILSVVCYAGLITALGAILRLILVGITKSPFANFSLAAFASSMPRTSFPFRLLMGVDLFIIWEMILVSMGIHITSEIKKENTYILVFIIWAVSLVVGALLGGLRGA